MTALLTAYRAATGLALPFVARRQKRRMAAAGVGDRLAERLGHAEDPRPGTIWVHAVSVGEAVSALPLVEILSEAHDVLLTTATATSAEIAARRLPPGARHAFAPFDAATPVRRFLDAHRPSLAVFVESELWPLQIMELSRRKIPLALVSARLSAKSAAGWARAPVTAKQIVSRIDYVAAQDRATAETLSGLGAPRVETTGSLKSAAPRLPVDQDAHATLAEAIGQRPVWLAASTHPGEEEIVAEAHRLILRSHPDALLILAPRHPERGDALWKTLGQPPRRSAGDLPGGGVYLADTMGEMGLWFSLAPVSFMGGSLMDGIGGHNPLEPARFGSAILTGPHTANAAAEYALLEAAGGAARAGDAEALAAAVLSAWDAPGMGAAALGALAPSDLPERIAATCLSLKGRQ